MYQILLVEDERWVRTAIRKILEKTGLPFTVVHEATNGMEAYDWLSENQVDLVMTDIHMPAMDGISLIGEMRSRGYNTDIIIISGYDDFSYAQQAIRLGAFDYMLKPVEEDGLSATLQKWLDQHEQKKLADANTNPTPQDINELSPIEQVIRYIDDSLTVDFTLTTASEMVHLSPSYFSKLFKQQTGINFNEYIIGARMKEASRLLETTSLRISEIAMRLGYTDLAYFSNTFKKIIGVSPSVYRKQQ